MVSEAISLSADTAPRHLSEHVGTRDHPLPAVGYVPRDHRSRAVIGSGLFLAAMQYSSWRKTYQAIRDVL